MKNYLFKVLQLSIIFSGLFFQADAQVSQVIRGRVINEENQPIINASIQLLGTDSSYHKTSDESGEFEFEASPGRYLVHIESEGYTISEEELLVVSGKTSSITIILKPSSVQLKDIEVRSPQYVQELPGAYSLSIEKTMRVPANFFDPARLTLSLPGVVPTNDQTNSISIKGYSPNALSWRLQGLDIVNPNHLANAGTLSDKPMANGGGVSILSSQVLDQTSFYSGALPVQYGNALSGAFDMSLRPGSKISREHTVQASLLGIDLATEGPFGKVSGESNSGSYLVNYRYSTVGLLALGGIYFGDEKINFQDLTFNLNFDLRKGRHFSFFGFGGLSANNFDHKPVEDWDIEKDRYDIDFAGKVFGVGISSTLLSNSKSLLKFGIAASTQDQTRHSQSQDITDPPQYVYTENYFSNRTLISSALNYSYRISSSISILTGVVATHFNHKLDVETITPLYINIYFPNFDGTVNGIFWQPYLNSEFKTKIADINLGVRYANFDYNGGEAIEPRMSIGANFLGGRLMLAYGLASQMQQTQTYLSLNNSSLALNRAHQYSINYQKSFSKQLSVGISAYYHQLFDVAVSSGPYPFSVINQMDEFVNDDLTSTGFGKNRGIDLSVEKRFFNKIYFLGGASWYESGYAGGNSAYFVSRYNGKFTYSLSGGKEWVGKKNKTFGIHARALYLGGLRQPIVNESLSEALGTTQYENDNLYQLELPDYFRVDLRASWRKNKPGYTRTWSIDVQNVSNQQNVAYYYYDTFTKKTETKYQLGIIPVLVYRIDF